MDLPYFGSRGDVLILISLVKKASKNNSVKRGVKEVVKSLRKKVIG
jgi:ribosomal protein L7Ae-like RNA K-turn-binding protein